MDTGVSPATIHLTTNPKGPAMNQPQHVEVKDRTFPTFTVTTVEARGMDFNRFLHDDGRYHTGVSFHNVTDAKTVESTITTDDGTFPTTTLTFRVNGEHVTVTLFGVAQ